MSQRDNFFNVEATDKGIPRELAEGMTTGSLQAMRQ